MKTFNFFKRTLLILMIFSVVSCVKVDEFDVPDTTVIAPEIDGDVIDIDALYNLWLQELNSNENAILTFEETNRYISGYVISNDEAGNFFEELLLQNKTENPTRGVKVLVDVNPLFTTFEFGRKVFVKLDGLTVGLDGGVLSLGIRDGNSLAKIAESQMDKTIIRASEVAEMIPMEMNISEFSKEKTNLYVRLTNVQFNRNEVRGNHPKTYAGEADDQFDGERILESCTQESCEGGAVVLSTSTFADFKALLLPVGSGTLDGILTRNFFGDAYNMVVNDPSFVNFINAERCDPIEIDCGLAETIGNSVLFSDFFETQTTGQPISGNGWTNYIEAGTEPWEAYADNGANASLGISARIGSFNSGDECSIAWLITPAVDFDTQEGETLAFKTSTSFADGSTLQALFSNDWNGDSATVADATWGLLTAVTLVQNNDDFPDWISSGKVDMSCVTGRGHIALKYIGSGNPENDGTYEFDEIELHAN